MNNMRTMYGLCAKFGIETDGKTPRELWREIHDAEERKKTEAARRMGVEREDDPDEEYSFGWTFGKSLVNSNIAMQLKKSAKHTPLKNYEPKEGFIALAPQGSPMSHKEADGRRVNPWYFTNSCNGGYNINCAMCVGTYEARRRGFNVRALPNLNTNEQNLVSEDIKSMFLSGRYQYLRKGEENSFLRQIHEGERYAFEYNTGDISNGHVVILTRIKGHNIWYDPQNGETKIGEALTKSLHTAKNARVLRIDNLKFNPQIINYIVRKV